MEREGALASSQPLPYTNFECLSQTQAHNAKIRKRSIVLTLAVMSISCQTEYFNILDQTCDLNNFALRCSAPP